MFLRYPATVRREPTLIEVLWARYHVDGVTGDMIGDMAYTVAQMLPDMRREYPEIATKLVTMVNAHKRVESLAGYSGRRWFCERFPEIVR